MATLTQLVDRVADRLSMVGGIGVQTYAEDRIGEMIQHKFDVLFDKAFWPQFCAWYQWSLDGTLGIVTTDLTNILKRFEDIQVIFRADTSTPVTKLSATSINPFTITGQTPVSYDALGPGDANKVSRVFRIWPLISNSDLVVRVRTKPDAFVGSDTIDFDEQALILGATYDYLEDDGTNPNATQKFQNLFESRVNQLVDNLNSAPISLDGVTTLPNTFSFVSL